ncbi:MAG: ATP-binding protein [Deltaproteobacteria bacterium]|nr:ATP-binding protein [Deltaproteobacteria bacterium]
MYYRKRHAEKKLLHLKKYFKVVLITGARQVGKSTLLAHLFPDVKTIVFDPIQDLYGARQDPDLFLDNFPPPLILDEIQFVPELLPALKRRVDRLDAPGQYILTGSQNLGMLRSIAESMAGRIAILPLESMTAHELSGWGARDGWLPAYLDEPDSLEGLFGGTMDHLGNLARFLWRGSMPGVLDSPDEIVPDYYRAYIQTYVERDIRLMEDIRELSAFGRFLGLSGALTAQEVNASQFGRDVGVTPATARKWLDLLTHTYQWLELFPYQGNTLKRLSGKRKGFLRDTGMGCHLQRISSPDALAVSPMLGPMFETWAVNEVLRQGSTLSMPPQAYHWRTGGGAEVDLLLERNGRLYPIEFKCKSNVVGHDIRGLRAFRETYPKGNIMKGLVLYAGKDLYRVDKHTIALPWNLRLRGSVDHPPHG